MENKYKVEALTKHGKIYGTRLDNNVQAFLNVQYALPVPRWTYCKPLPEDYHYRHDQVDCSHYRYFCAQPLLRSKKAQKRAQDPGEGAATECPFYCDVLVPSDVDLQNIQNLKLPVHVFIHGGSFQYGSTSNKVYKTKHYPCEMRDEIFVNLSYRVSILGFLTTKTGIAGNYGLNDMWTGLEWVKNNIASFGGDPDNIKISGQSSGAVGVHYLLVKAAKNAPLKAPFNCAEVHSGGIPDVPMENEFHFQLICKELGLNPQDPKTIDKLRDENLYSTEKLIDTVMKVGGVSVRFSLVEDETLADFHEYNKSGKFGKDLKQAGIKYVLLSETGSEHIYFEGFYILKSRQDIEKTARSVMSKQLWCKVTHLFDIKKYLDDGMDPSELYGRIIADCSVYCPIGAILSSLTKAGVPVIRQKSYYVTDYLKSCGIFKPQHASDNMLVYLNEPLMTKREISLSIRLQEWINLEIDRILSGGELRGPDEMLIIEDNGKLRWGKDNMYDYIQSRTRFIQDFKASAPYSPVFSHL